MTNNKRTLGRTGIEITPIGQGVMQFAGGKGMFRAVYAGMSQEAMDAVIQAALEGGINWFDTAELYGKGRSEQGLAHGLHAAGVAKNEALIATKWWPLLRSARNIPKTIDERLRFLDGYPITLYQIHQPFSFSSPEAEMNAMADLVEAGKIKAVGVSNFSAGQMRRAHAALAKRGLPLASNQVHYSLLSRDIERNGILDAAKALGVTIIAWSPINSGLLSGKFHQNPALLKSLPRGRRMRFRRQIEQSRPLVEALDAIATARGVTVAQVALNWLIHFHGETVVAIPGASKVRQAQENAGVLRFRLTENELARLDEVSRQAASQA